MADQVKAEPKHSCGYTGATGRYDRLLQIDGGLGELRAEFGGGKEGLVVGVEQIGERQVVGAGNMAAAPSRPEFRLAAREPSAAARIQDLIPLGPQVRHHLRLVADLAVIQA